MCGVFLTFRSFYPFLISLSLSLSKVASPDRGLQVAVGTADGRVSIWETSGDASTKEAVRTLDTQGGEPVPGIAWPTDREMFTAGWDGRVRVWDVTEGRAATTFGAPAALLAVSWSPHANLLVTGDAGFAVRLWDPRAATGAARARLVSHRQWVVAVHWRPESAHHFVSVGRDGTAKVWDVRSETPLLTLAAPE